MKREALMTWPQVGVIAAVITLLATAFALWQRLRAITRWADSVVQSQSGNCGVPGKL